VLILIITGSIIASISNKSLVNATASPNSSTDITTTPTSTAQKLNVVTSVSPITNIIKNIGGNKIDLTGLVPEGVNSHIFELVPSDVVKVNNADLVIINGLGLGTNLEDVAEEARSKYAQLQILKLGDNTITHDQ
jgi:ABC-type Zn uptake system ZnuABC Zn-binding protein ZnuA